MENMILHALKSGTKKKVAPKHLKEFHAKEQSDGKYHVVRHSGKPSEAPQEHTVDNLSDVEGALNDHLGTPNDGEEEAANGGAPDMGAGQPGMGGM